MLITKPGMMVFFTVVTFLSCFVFLSGEKQDPVNLWVMIYRVLSGVCFSCNFLKQLSRLCQLIDQTSKISWVPWPDGLQARLMID